MATGPEHLRPESRSGHCVTGGGARHTFTAEQVTTLLAELGQRLRKRGVAAAVFVVGGAAIAATNVRDGRLTADIDALTDDQVVLEEPAVLAVERGLPPDWINLSARPWMPPLPQACCPGRTARGFALRTRMTAFCSRRSFRSTGQGRRRRCRSSNPPGHAASHGRRARGAHPPLLHRPRSSATYRLKVEINS